MSLVCCGYSVFLDGDRGTGGRWVGGGGVKVDTGNSRADEEPVTKSHIRSLVHDPASGGWAPAMIQKYRPIHQLVPIESKRLPTYRLFMRDTPRPTTQNQQVQRRE